MPSANVDSEESHLYEIKWLWLSFSDKSIGREQKRKCAAFVGERNDIDDTWVPKKPRSATITLENKRIKCKCKQFPLIAACALTVHKSQESTFEKVVYEYSHRHQQMLIYVALSRATSLEGTYITNANNLFRFFHHEEQPNVEVRREFERLQSTRRLITIGERVQRFVIEALTSSPGALVLFTFNVQSLRAHKRHLEADFVLPRCKVMALSETWVNDDQELTVHGFNTVSRFKRTTKRAGGVAILESKEYSGVLAANRHELFKFDKIAIRRVATADDGIGDICAADILINGQKALLVCVYISPGTPLRDIETFFEMNFWAYSAQAKVINFV